MFFFVPGASAQTDSEFKPYLARVAVDQSKIHAGPADVHYATEQLAIGDEVQVYQHDPGGWCAIRPPTDSFSMILAQDIELLSDQVARVTNEGAKCWVGTNLDEPEQPMWQVRLAKGEKLRLIGVVKEQYVLEADQPDWIQVAPPRGEFRWIHISNISRIRDLPTRAIPDSNQRSIAAQEFANPDDQNQGRTSQDRFGQRNPQNSLNESDSSVLSELKSSDTDSQYEGQPFSRNRQPTPASEFDIVENNSPGEGFVNGTNVANNSYANSSDSTVNNGADENGGWRPSTRSVKDIMPEVTGTNGPSFASVTSGTNNVATVSMQKDISSPVALPPLDPTVQLSGNIQRMELELTLQVSKDPQDYRLEPLIAECRYFIDNSSDLQERERAQRLLDKALQFQRVQASYATSEKRWPMGAASGGPTQSNNSTGNASGSNPVSSIGNGATPSTEPDLSGNYDGIGMLNELTRNNGRVRPTYVLQDENGKILCHVAPAPGVNLHRYLKKNIAVVGQRGFNRQLNLKHITAERVVELQSINR